MSMKNASDEKPEFIIIQKFNELVKRYSQDSGTAHFSEPEKIVWSVVCVRCEMDINGFASVFEQLISRDELTEFIGYLKQIGLDELSAYFQQIANILEEHSFYNESGHARKMCFELPPEVVEIIDQIEDKVIEENELWGVDPTLCRLLNE